MSDIRRKTINGNEYMFVNRFRGNRSGFVHETELFKNSRSIGSNRIQYYNRTWECYTYQTVMKGCIRELMEAIENDHEMTWKHEHGIKRLTKEKRKVMEDDFYKNQPVHYAELAELYTML